MPNSAKNAVQRPDAVDHLNPEDFRFPEQTFYSVSVKFFGESLKRYGLVALSERRGDELIILTVWKFFVQDLDLENARSPVDVLRAFAERYGTDLRIAGEVSKFILYKTVAMSTVGSPPTADKLISIIGGERRNISALLLKIDTVARQVKIGVAYNIDMEKYARDLRKRGVKPKF